MTRSQCAHVRPITQVHMHASNELDISLPHNLLQIWDLT
jgi:hypothetical protein